MVVKLFVLCVWVWSSSKYKPIQSSLWPRQILDHSNWIHRKLAFGVLQHPGFLQMMWILVFSPFLLFYKLSWYPASHLLLALSFHSETHKIITSFILSTNWVLINLKMKSYLRILSIKKHGSGDMKDSCTSFDCFIKASFFSHISFPQSQVGLCVWQL